MFNSIYVYVIFLSFVSSIRVLSVSTISKLPIAHAPYNIILTNYKVNIVPEQNNIKARIFKNSVKWVRDEHNILSPEARIQVSIPHQYNSVSIKHNEVIYKPSKVNGQYVFDLWVNLFLRKPIRIKLDNTFKSLAINYKIIPQTVIDKSCIPYSLELNTSNKESYMVGCLVDYIGTWHKRKKRITVSYQKIGKLKKIQRVIIHKSGEYSLSSTTTIKVKFKRRQRRLKTAWGFGPYQLETKNKNSKINELAPAFMLYGRYDLVSKSSLRFFDAFIKNESHFNNGGLYFAYELVSLYDGNISISPLLGAQILSFKFDRHTPSNNKIIYPQGVELAIKHTLGIQNLTTVVGLFISRSESDPYTNLWIRAGKKYFYELNYIKWSNQLDEMRTYGISIGMPLASFL